MTQTTPVEQIAGFTGLKQEEVKSIWQAVKANSKALSECPRHRFIEEKVTIGQKLKCVNCGGEVRLTDIGQYLAGYKAAGGDTKDVWEAYK